MAAVASRRSRRHGPALSTACARVLLAACVLLAQRLGTVAADGWTDGRASFYGNDGGATVHQGSCMFGQLDYNRGLGYNIAALSDRNWDFDQSCGRCVEVSCRKASFSDGYGQWMERSNVCYDESKTITVQLTDACPCSYPNNAYSNKRWCCGDMQHIDLSYTAFQQLADLSWGVIAVRWRTVACPSDALKPQDWQRNKRNRKQVAGSY